jgi:hypothetical protein
MWLQRKFAFWFSLSTAGQVTGIFFKLLIVILPLLLLMLIIVPATFNYVLKLNQIPVTVAATPSQTKNQWGKILF